MLLIALKARLLLVISLVLLVVDGNYLVQMLGSSHSEASDEDSLITEVRIMIEQHLRARYWLAGVAYAVQFQYLLNL